MRKIYAGEVGGIAVSHGKDLTLEQDLDSSPQAAAGITCDELTTAPFPLSPCTTGCEEEELERRKVVRCFCFTSLYSALILIGNKLN